MRSFHLTRQQTLALLLAIAMLAVALALLPSVTQARESRATGQERHATSLALLGDYRLLATEIDGQNAHLQLLPDLLYPSLTFTATAIQGLMITQPVNHNSSLTLTATTATTTNVAIKTSVFSDLTTALGSFANKADLLTLIAGGTVPLLKMTNVNLAIDHSMTVASIIQTNFHIAVTSGIVSGANLAPTVTPTAGATGTPTAGVTPTPGPTKTVTPGSSPTASPPPGTTPTPLPTQRPGPTVTPQPTPTPAPTATAIPTPPPVTNWLQVVPTTLNLTCGQSVNVTLQNLGPTAVYWSVAVPFLGDIAVSPLNGWLNSGASATIRIANTALLFAHQDALVFTAYTSHAGQPATLSYTLKPCL